MMRDGAPTRVLTPSVTDAPSSIVRAEIVRLQEYADMSDDEMSLTDADKQRSSDPFLRRRRLNTPRRSAREHAASLQHLARLDACLQRARDMLRDFEANMEKQRVESLQVRERLKGMTAADAHGVYAADVRGFQETVARHLDEIGVAFAKLRVLEDELDLMGVDVAPFREARLTIASHLLAGHALQPQPVVAGKGHRLEGASIGSGAAHGSVGRHGG